MMRYLVFLVITFLSFTEIQAQDDGTEYGGYNIGVKGGLTVGLQRWNTDTNRDPLFQYHAAVSIESLNDDESPFSIFAQAGYHVRGSAQRLYATQFVNQTGTTVDVPARSYTLKFHNAALQLGGKKYFNLSNNDAYYSIAIRGEYTFRDSLEGFYYSSFSQDIRKFNYGLTVGGGIEFPLSNFINGFIEITISPDFSKQLFVPSGKYFYPQQIGSNVSRPFPEQNVTNTSFEVSFGVRFQRIIEYIDD